MKRFTKQSHSALVGAAAAFLCAALAFAIALVIWTMRAKTDELQAAEWGGAVVIGVCPAGTELVLRRNGLAACAIIVAEPK